MVCLMSVCLMGGSPNKKEACPAGLGRGIHAGGGRSRKVRLPQQ